MAKIGRLPIQPGADKRTYLPAKERRLHLIETGMTLVRRRGWDELSIARLARLAGISRQLVYRHFEDVEQLALELAERFQDEIYNAAVGGLERYQGEFSPTMRQPVEAFLVGLRRERLAYYELLGGHWPHPRLPRAIGKVRARLRRKMVEFWSEYYQREIGLTKRDAMTLSSFQYSGLHGLVVLVDSGQLEAAEAIDFYVGVIEAAIQKCGGRLPAATLKAKRR